MARLTRWTYAQLGSIASAKAQAESVMLLLKEYEHRGVGWLWQVDAENRVVYISSRMTSLLGRSANQLMGHSLPATLGGNSVLGRTLLARQPFANLEMELKTRRGTRWISLSGDPIIDMAGQFQGFRGVGSDITEVRRTQERLTNLANLDVLSGLPTRKGFDAAKGEKIFADNCVACHGDGGKGNAELGAPNLTDKIWLYGSDEATLIETISQGRAGVMPAWEGRLDPSTIKAMAVYVHSLGGGK